MAFSIILRVQVCSIAACRGQKSCIYHIIAAPLPDDEMAEEAPVAGPTHTAEEKDQSKRNKDHKQDNLQSTQHHFPH